MTINQLSVCVYAHCVCEIMYWLLLCIIVCLQAHVTLRMLIFPTRPMKQPYGTACMCVYSVCVCVYLCGRPSVCQTIHHLSFISLWFTFTFNSCPCLKVCVVSFERHDPMRVLLYACVYAVRCCLTFARVWVRSWACLIARSLHPEATTAKALKNHNSQSGFTAVTLHQWLPERSRPWGGVRQPQ